MSETPLGTPWLFPYVILPILIFLARITDVSLGTMRIVFLSRGFRYIAPLVGFFEILIWLMTMREIFKHLNNWPCFLGYAGGFATGNYLGMVLESRIAIGFSILRIITADAASELYKSMIQAGFRVTKIMGQGVTGPVQILFTVLKRKDIPEALELIRRYQPQAFYSLEDVRYAHQPLGRAIPSTRIRGWERFFRFYRKGK